MKRILLLSFAVLCLAACQSGNPQLGKASIDKVLQAMTLEEKVHFVIGTADGSLSEAVVGQTKKIVPGAAGTTYPIDRLGIPSIVLADGPAGLRIDPTREGDSETYYCTHFPIATLLSSTWNQELVESVGQSMGEEVHEYGADVYLAPALNIHRHPLNGRNFEYYSEDPVLAGKTAAAFVRGVQSNDVGTSIKHFAFNNQETNRTSNNAIISPRAQREIYLKGFEIAVKEAAPWTVMSSYNKINGTYTSQSKDLLTTILRDEWGFQGLVMSDWYGGVDGAEQIAAGNDMLQPGTTQQYEQIMAALKDGSLTEAELDVCVRRCLELVARSPKAQGYAYSNKPDLQAHAAVTRQSALEGMVLLENKGVLPLKGVKNVAVFGCTSFDFIAGGTGSGNVNRAYTVSLLDGLKNAGFNVDDSKKDVYLKHIADEEAAYRATLSGPYAPYLPSPRPSELVPPAAEVAASARANDVAIITLGRNSGEFFDRTSADFELSANERLLLNRVSSAFHALGKKVIVVLNIGGVIETASWKGIPDAILLAWQAGQEGGNSVTDILTGASSPSGKLPMTFPLSLADIPASKNFPIDTDTDLYFLEKRVDVGEKNVDFTRYEEDIWVGYRYFTTANIPVSYPFGYGLSYTSFQYSDALAAVASDGSLNVSVTVTNTGDVAGKEAVQLYVSAPAGGLEKPARELKAYAKTHELQPGESETLSFTVDAYALASFNEAACAWETAAGSYQAHLAASATDIRLSLPFEEPTELSWPVHPACLMQE